MAGFNVGDRVKVVGEMNRTRQPNIGRLGIIERVTGKMSDGQGPHYLVHLYDQTWADHEAASSRGATMSEWYGPNDLEPVS